MWRVSNASFQIFQATGTITGAGCQATAPGGSWLNARKSGLQGQEAGRLEATWGLMRMKGSVEDVEQTHRQRYRISGSYSRGVEGTKGGGPENCILAPGAERKGKAININSKLAP